MAHLKNYYDLSESTYLELGLSGLWGTNNRRGFVDDAGDIRDEPWRYTVVGGADLTIQWSPLQQAKYRSLTWRSEGYLVHRQTTTRDEDISAGWAENDGDRISWGVYSYIDYQLATRWFAGVRGDLAIPTIRTKEDVFAWDVVPYLTFWQSEFVYLRLEYRYTRNIPFQQSDESFALRTDHRVLLQIDFAAGPHKHEKY
jgi:hypothetical protein